MEVRLNSSYTVRKPLRVPTNDAVLAGCRFEHPGVPTSGNPFTKPQDGANPYKISKEMIKIDLAEERPSWILSCYGPGKDAPDQLFGGYPREQSLEEVMVYIRGSANQQQAVSFISS
ncbi:hypothetical protein O1611_g9414 [Lasiodiplodia mahajangana]|uniref:Uncharacterized protein n=1 Tax=Lasiodiplodia mahajangana TaxID=1108764 RepID=A0ACC2JA73_9PEZI|nr:hypothetical protein O1611_g9414 [Lasiodiplodia mahajangana]